MNPQSFSKGPQLEEPPVNRGLDLPPVSNWWDEDEPARTGFKKFRTPLMVGLLTAGSLVAGWKLLGETNDGLVRHVPATIVTVSIRDFAPLPTPPKVIEPEKKPDVVDAVQDPVVPKVEQPTPEIGTANPSKGIGDLPYSRKGPRIGSGGLSVQETPAAIWTRYARQAQDPILEAMRNNPKTRMAKFTLLDVRLLPDATTGRVTRAALVGTTGDAAVDRAIRDEVLVGMVMPQPPPPDMPLPINLRVRATRGN